MTEWAEFNVHSTVTGHFRYESHQSTNCPATDNLLHENYNKSSADWAVAQMAMQRCTTPIFTFRWGWLSLMHCLSVISQSITTDHILPKTRFAGRDFGLRPYGFNFNHFDIIGPQSQQFHEITQNNGHYFIQSHSTSPLSVPIKSPYAISYVWAILPYILSQSHMSHCFRDFTDYWSNFCCWQPIFNTLVWGDFQDSGLRTMASRNKRHCSMVTWVWQR